MPFDPRLITTMGEFSSRILDEELASASASGEERRGSEDRIYEPWTEPGLAEVQKQSRKGRI